MEAFNCKTNIISGADALAALEDLHIQRLFLVCDPFFEKNGTAQRIISAAGCRESEIFSQVVPDPTVTLAARGASALNAFRPDTVIALGGGSAMDCAKAMAYFSDQDPLLVAIPTTSGSGSEVTDFAILTHDGVKHPLVDPRLRPDVAILDSDLVSTLPPSLVADGGFDLISHALEAYVATNSGVFSDMLATAAFQVALSGLRSSFDADPAQRGALHQAATMAGLAFSNAGLGLCHAISHSLGGEFHIPHGRLNAILLPAIIDANSRICAHRYAQLARSAGLSSGSDAMALRSLKNALIRLRRSLSLPESLAQAGVCPAIVREKLDAIVPSVLADPCCRTNPLPPDEETVRQIIMEVTGHD